MKWTNKFPQEEGLFWFYGYPHGKVTCGTENNPELGMVEVSKISNGYMYVYNGHFIYEMSAECPHFQKIILPELPTCIGD